MQELYSGLCIYSLLMKYFVHYFLWTFSNSSIRNISYLYIKKTTCLILEYKRWWVQLKVDTVSLTGCKENLYEPHHTSPWIYISDTGFSFNVSHLRDLKMILLWPKVLAMYNTEHNLRYWDKREETEIKIFLTKTENAWGALFIYFFKRLTDSPPCFSVAKIHGCSFRETSV